MAPRRKWFPIDKVCPVCKKTWTAKTSYQIQTQRCCSYACLQKGGKKGRNKVERIKRDCKNCGEAMEVLPCHSKTKWFCSYSCGNSYNNRGDRNAQWQGGDSLGKYWKRKARERDDFTCQFPGCKKRHEGNTIHAHHKVPRAAGGSDNLENIISLCSKHHREMERQLLQFIIEKHPTIIEEAASKLYSW